MGGADEVAGDYLRGSNVRNLLTQVGVQGNIAQEVINFIDLNFLGELQIQHSHGDIRGRNADGVAGELAFEFWQSLGYSLRCASFCQHHVQTCSATAAVTLVVVINEVLVIGK